jgi:hypothetical protein
MHHAGFTLFIRKRQSQYKQWMPAEERTGMT